MGDTKSIGIAYRDQDLKGATLTDCTLAGTTAYSNQQAALTPQLTSITIADAVGTPDYALSALTTTTPYGLATKAEAVTLLYVIANLQVRVAELESRVVALGLVA